MKELESLKKIQKVDAPEFLFTRIEQKLKNQSVSSFSNSISWSMIAGIAVLVAVNVLLFSDSTDGKDVIESEYSSLINVQTTNHSFYHE